MSSARLSGRGGRPQNGRPVASQARVVFYPGERPAVERIVRRLFGRGLQVWEYAGLAGAPDETEVEVGTLHGELYMEAHPSVTDSYHGVQLVRRGPGGPILVNELFRIADGTMRRQGLGLWIFGRQLAYARSLGIGRIETTAGRQGGENGYYTWPRFGFDGPLPPAVKRDLPLGLADAQTVLDLMRCEEGRLWWSDHGTTLEVSFDLTVQSRSWKAFTRYRRAKLRGGPGCRQSATGRVEAAGGGEPAASIPIVGEEPIDRVGVDDRLVFGVTGPGVGTVEVGDPVHVVQESRVG